MRGTSIYQGGVTAERAEMYRGESDREDRARRRRAREVRRDFSKHVDTAEAAHVAVASAARGTALG